jgi:hypothetical protein
MSLLLLLLLFFTNALFTHTQPTIHIGIIDDNDYPKGILNIDVPNVTFCGYHNIKLQIYWINASNSLFNLIDELELQENLINIYLARTRSFSTKLIEDFSQTYQIPFISMHSYGSITTFVVLFLDFYWFFYFDRSFNFEYSLMPNMLRVLISYLKYHHIQKAAYIYNNDQATRRIFELLQLMSNDEYFNNFSLDIRTTRHQDVYSLLYSIEVNSFNKEQPPKYILLDLDSYVDYEKMFEKISHMGLYI